MGSEMCIRDSPVCLLSDRHKARSSRKRGACGAVSFDCPSRPFVRCGLSALLCRLPRYRNALPYLPRRFFRSLCARLVRFAKYGGKFFLKATKGARFPSVRLFGRADCYRAHLASFFRVCLALGTCAQPSLCASRGRGVFLSPRSCVRRSPAAPCRGSYPAVCSFHALVGASAGLLCGRFFFVCRRRNTPRLGRASLLCVFYFSVGQAQSSRAFEKGSFGDNLPFVCGRRVRAQPVKGASAERKKTVKRFSCIFGTNMV